MVRASSSILLPVATPALAVLAAASGGVLPAQGDVPAGARATLELAPVKFDFAGTRAAMLMYMPASAELTTERPDCVKKEPDYRGVPRYAVIALGNGPAPRHAIAFDEPDGEDARIYLDLDGDGDLTDDGDGSWTTKSVSDKAGAAPSYQGTWTFDVGWYGPDGQLHTGKYGLNFYRSPDRGAVNYYRAGCRVGEIALGGRKYEVTLLENDNDALFNKPFERDGVQVVGAAAQKPVWLMLDGDRVDVRGTFEFAGMNWAAEVSDDGSRLEMAPTFKVVRAPRPVEQPQMRPAGGPAPDFQALRWTASGEEESFELLDYRGEKIVVLDLWATWCGPCVAALPHLGKVYAAVKDKDVVVIALNVHDDEPAYRRFVTERGQKLGLEFARDPAGREREASIAKRLFDVTAIPATYVIDKDGKITAAISGYREGDRAVESALQKLGVTID